MMSIAALLKLFLSSFFVACVAIPVFRSLALRFNIVDAPDGVLKKHKKITPYLGGFSIYISLWFVYILFFGLDSSYSLGMFTGSTFIVILGTIDDLFVLTPKQKFYGQVVVALILVGRGFYINVGFNVFFEKIISFLWLVSMMNAFNLVDVMDGLTATISICSMIGLLGYSICLNQQNLASLLLILLGSMVAFFLYNAPPATIYLGDAGSMLLGLVISGISLLINWPELKTKSLFNLAVPLIILAIPILETMFLILIRKWKKIPFYNGSPDHFAHYLQSKNWSKWQILLYIFLYSLMLIILSVFVAQSESKIMAVAITGSLLFIVWTNVVFGDSSQKTPN